MRVVLAGHLLDVRAARELERLARVVLAEVDRLAHVRVGLRPRLARLDDLERGELGRAACA